MARDFKEAAENSRGEEKRETEDESRIRIRIRNEVAQSNGSRERYLPGSRVAFYREWTSRTGNSDRGSMENERGKTNTRRRTMRVKERGEEQARASLGSTPVHTFSHLSLPLVASRKLPAV